MEAFKKELGFRKEKKNIQRLMGGFKLPLCCSGVLFVDNRYYFSFYGPNTKDDRNWQFDILVNTQRENSTFLYAKCICFRYWAKLSSRLLFIASAWLSSNLSKGLLLRSQGHIVETSSS